jgi:ubiquinone/menaquinone biosynthesis C-methylase UbiE
MEKCIICGNDDFKLIFNGTLKKCTRCGFATANLAISRELLEKIYSVNYFMGEEYLDYLKDKEILQLNFEKRIRHILSLIPENVPVKNCLEIGSAYGFFGETLLKHVDAPYRGIDVVPEAVTYGREVLGLDLVQGDYLEMPAPERPYTDIFMWDVIEHLQYPAEFLQKAYRELVPGGRIYITTGDFGALLPRIQGSKWRMIHPPSHLHYFTRNNLHRLLEAQGFSIVSSTYLPVYRSIRQVYYSLFLLNKSRKTMEKWMGKIPGRWNISMNTRDIVFVIGQKI